MTAKSATNLAASVRARLLEHARSRGEDYQRVLTRFAIERLLFRLSQTEATETYILKGAMLLVTWPEHALRPTGDLDLLGNGDPEPAAIAELFERICIAAVPDDGVVFDPATLRVNPVREADRYQGVELRVVAHLGTARILVQVDIGFGDHVYPRPTRANFPRLLPDFPEPSILMYPPETVVAEKFEAMIRFGEANSRIKDFHDIWVTTRTFDFNMPILVEAIAGTLRRRETAIPSEIPVGLTDAFVAVAQGRGLWSGFLRRNPPAQSPESFSAMLVDLRRFFAPVIVALADPESARGHWHPGGGGWGEAG